MHGKQSTLLACVTILVLAVTACKSAYLYPPLIERHSAHKHSDLHDGIQQHTSCRIQGEVADSRHRNDGTQSKCDDLRDGAQQDGRAHLRKCPGYALLDGQEKWNGGRINRLFV